MSDEAFSEDEDIDEMTGRSNFESERLEKKRDSKVMKHKKK